MEAEEGWCLIRGWCKGWHGVAVWYGVTLLGTHPPARMEEPWAPQQSLGKLGSDAVRLEGTQLSDDTLGKASVPSRVE